MLLPDGNVKLIDFGIARWLHPARMKDTMQLGTDGYAPLEQYSSRSEPRSDIYALGASLYHLLTGRVPEAAPLRMAGHNLRPIRELNPRTPEVVERVILKALNLQPQERYRDAQAMREALELARRQAQSHSAGVSAGGSRAGAPSGGIGRMTSLPASSPSSAHDMRSPLAPHAAHSTRPPTGPVGPHRSGASALPPRLTVWPMRMDAGYILVNQTATYRLEIANRGGGALSGRSDTNFAALSVEPQKFNESCAALTVRIDATGLAIGPYVCHIAVRSNGGDQIVQVRFVVRPAGDVAGGRSRATGQ
jgi:serine/threonine protein kinase